MNICKFLNIATFKRYLTISSVRLAIPKKNKLPPRPTWLVKDDEIEEVFLKGGRGPGGQKINKTNSKVQLTHIPTGIVVQCQFSRSQERNRKRAREILALKLEELNDPENCRTAMISKRVSMTKASKQKKSNRKYKKLEQEKLRESSQQIHEEIDVELELTNLKVDMDYLKKHL